MSKGTNRPFHSIIDNPDGSSDNKIQHLASMMQTVVHAVLLLDSNCDLIENVNIDLLQPDDLDIDLVPEASFREFIFDLGKESEQTLKIESRKVRLTGSPTCLTVRGHHIDHDQYYEVNIQPFAKEPIAGTHCVWHIQKVDNDLTTEEKTENNAENISKEALLNDLFEISSDAIIIFDRFQKIITVNPTFEKLIAPHNEHLSSANDIIFCTADEKCLNSAIWQSLFYEGHWSGEVYIHHRFPEKTPYWLTVDSFYQQGAENKEQRIATHYLFSLRSISELKDTQAALEHSATHDQLTGLPNRGYFISHLKKALTRAKNQQMVGTLLFIDLDNFKLINDVKGHMIGDVLLLMMASRLKNIFRNGEMVARLGGDEFTLVVEDVQNAANAVMIAQRILDDLAVPFNIENTPIEIQCSIGISLFPNDDANADKLIKQADTAMYAAKAGGKNNIQLFDSTLTKETARKFSIETHIRKAIENNELALHYQPQFDMKNNALIGAEALLRWQNHELGSVSPAVFIPVIESAGIIDEIGLWILDNVCQQISVWRKFNSMHQVISVNASRLQLVKSDFVKQIDNLLTKHGLSGEHLEIEVTENAFISSEKNMINNLHVLREIGCKIAIDDFGTGYSSLSNLQSFPLDRLKIDRSFVEKLDYDDSAMTIASAIVSLGKSLGLDIIAEGVETKKQTRQLLKMGCRQAQGYYYGRPIAAPEFSTKHFL